MILLTSLGLHFLAMLFQYKVRNHRIATAFSESALILGSGFRNPRPTTLSTVSQDLLRIRLSPK